MAEKIKVYRLILDGKTTEFLTDKVFEFEEEIRSDYLELFETDIYIDFLNKMLRKISRLRPYESAEFKGGYFKFICLEMEKDDYERERNFLCE